MRPTRFVATVAAAVALGALVVGRGVLLPAIDATTLLDANLAKALAGPLHLRVAEVALVANLVVAALARRWIGARWATTVALVAVVASTVHRFLLLPAMYAAWSRADLIAGRPVDRVLYGERLAGQELWLVGSIAVLLLALLFAGTELTTPEPASADAEPETAPRVPPAARAA